MRKQNAKDAAGFEPPKYLASLIGAINDGAKAAQGSALLFLLVGLYLLATAFSASDEDLLLGKAVTISQIGVSLPVTFSFAIAPLVFVFLHFYTLVRYDMLAANVRHFLRKMQQVVQGEAEHEDCRQLLANVEFVQALTAPRGSALYSAIWRWLFRGIVAVFPVFVLLLVQINALRYQSALILWVQRAWLILDLLAVVWFFRRTALNGSAWPDRRAASAQRWAGLLWMPAAVLALNLLYLNVVPQYARPGLVRYEGPKPKPKPGYAKRVRRYIADVWRQPLDVVFCYSLKWGCRYLLVDYRTLVDKVWDNGAMARLRAGGADTGKPLTGVDGLVLRGRSLRFAVLNDSRLYEADLGGAQLQGANLYAAQLQGANLGGAQLQGADLGYTRLQGANLFATQLQGANLSAAELQGANLGGAQLQGADLGGAQLQGAYLFATQLRGANLSGADVQGADLTLAQLQVADLDNAQLEAACLRAAQLQGADLSHARLEGADLFSADLWRATMLQTHLALADLRNARFNRALTDKEQADLRQLLDALPPGEMKSKAEKRLDTLTNPLALADLLDARFNRALTDKEQADLRQQLDALPPG